MALAPQPQRELWSMDPTPVLQPNAVRPEMSASRYPTAAWPAVPTSEPAPPAYKMPSPLIPSSPAPEVRPAPRGVDADLQDFLSGLTTPVPAPTTQTQTLAPSFPTQSPAPAPQVSTPSTPVHSAPQPAPLPVTPQVRPVQPASPAPNMAEVSNQLMGFMRRVEDNFNVVTRQLSEVERRLGALEQASKDAVEQNRTSAMEKKRMLETIQQQLTELRRQTAMATVAAPLPSQPAYTQPPVPVPQAPAPAYSQSPPAMTQSALPTYPQRLPPLQPANSLYMPLASSVPSRTKSDQEEADRMLALRLQEEINREAGSDGLLPGVDTARMHSKPTPGGPSSHSEAHSECPICGMEQPISQIEAHVNKHLEENPGAATQEQKEGFLSWLFASKKAQQTPARPEPPKLTPPKPSAPVAKAQPQPQVLNLGQPGLYPSSYRYGTQGMQGMQIPPGMQLATIPPGAPIPPGAVPLGAYPGVYPPPSQMYYSQVGQAP